MAFGLMGAATGTGHLQVLVDMIDLGANPQAASDAARFTQDKRPTSWIWNRIFTIWSERPSRPWVIGSSPQTRGHGRISGDLVPSLWRAGAHRVRPPG